MAETWQQAICRWDMVAFANNYRYSLLFGNGCELESKLNAIYSKYEDPLLAEDWTYGEELHMHRLMEEALLCLRSFRENQTLICECVGSVPSFAYIQRCIVSFVQEQVQKNTIWQLRMHSVQKRCNATTLRLEQSCGIFGKSTLSCEENIGSKNYTDFEHTMHSEEKRCDATTLRVEQSCGFFGKSALSWEENIASKNYTDFEHRGLAFTQLSGFEDGLLRSPNGKKLIPVRIVEVDATLIIVRLMKEDAKLSRYVYGCIY